MQDLDLDFELIYQSILSNDYAFYGLIGLVVLLLLAMALRLANIGRGKDEFQLEDDEEEAEGVSDIVEQLGTPFDEAKGGQERIEEPLISGTIPESVAPAPSQKGGSTDTVEVYRRITPTSGDAAEFEVRPIGSRPQAEPAQPIEKPEIAPEEKKKPVAKKKIKKPEKPAAPKTLQEGLAKTKGGFMNRFNKLVLGTKKIDEEVFEELEEILYEADIGPTASRLFEKITEQAKRKELADGTKLKGMLRDEVASILTKAQTSPVKETKKPYVILMVGVNGVGKTTTIGKLAKQYQDEGKKVILAAGDTFRAAAVEQLEIWGERSGAEVITAKEGANPSGVVYNAVQAAIAREADILIADTAGRLHTKYNLMEELRKIKSVSAKALGRDPDEIWLVIDANTGQNAVNQAAKFNETLSLTGLILTKLDGTAKGGVVIGITDQLGLPIHYIGIGEQVGDLRRFEAKPFVEALFD